MLYKKISSILIALGLAGFVVYRAANVGSHSEHIYAALVACGVGIVLVAFTLFSVRRMLGAPLNRGVGAILVVGFGVKLLGILIIFGAWALSRKWFVDLSFDLTSALMAYLSCIFLGYAWQTKLVEGQLEDTTGSSTQSYS